MHRPGLRKPIRPDRIRSVPRSFSWIDRDLLHHGYLARLTREEILLYFFLALVGGPQGTSYWSYRRIANLLKLTVDQLNEATRGLLKKDLIAHQFPRFQVLSLPPQDPREA